MTLPRTLTDLYFAAQDRFGARPVAMRAKRGGAWQDVSYAALHAQVRGTSLGLAALGLAPGDRVAILSENRPEWAIADYACLAARCADVPIYPTLPPKQIQYILADAGAAAVFVSTRAQLEKILEIREELPALRHIVSFEPSDVAGVRSLASLVALGETDAAGEAAWRAAACRVAPDDLATLIYTSGTTGEPKGVMLTHGNIASNVVAGLAVLGLAENDECLSFLPLSHIFERMAGHYVMFHAGVTINYATSVDTVPAEMLERQPTVVVSVPRLYEKIFARVVENANAGGALKAALFRWARRSGETWTDLVLARRPVPALLRLQKAVGDRLVFSKLRARTGGRLRFFVSGGAPLSPELGRFFHAAGLKILEGYGLTETSPVICVNTHEHLRIGTVGRPIPGVEVRIAGDGEICTRGPHVMRGYYNKPEATREVLTDDGWFHTGDIGELDADGYLRITDRKKDLIVTAGGKNIAPQPIENRLKGNRYVTNAVMLGDRRKFPIVLVVPNLEALQGWALHTGLAFTSEEELLRLPASTEKLEREVQRTLHDVAKFELPKKVILLARDFTIESGELTPTLKVKRRVVEARYREQIEALYAEDVPTERVPSPGARA